jgi:hypothetical protein
MTATAGSQLFGPWYDVIGAVLISGIFFYLAFAQPTLALSTKQRRPAFLSKQVCIALGLCGAAMAIFKVADMPAPGQELPAVTVAALSAAPEWQVIHTGDEGETLSIDLNSIARNGDTVGYSEQLAYKTPKPYPMPVGTVASAKARLLVNCTDRTRILQEFVMVRSDGSTVLQDTTAGPPVLPVSSDPSRPEYISSNSMCGPRQ